MATLITKAVNSAGGGDYTTLASAFTALKQDLPASGNALRLEISGTVGDAQFAIGWVTTASNYVEIIRVGGNKGAYSYADRRTPRSV